MTSATPTTEESSKAPDTGPSLRTSVAQTVKNLQFDYLHSPQLVKQARAKAVLANLRKFSSASPYEQPLALEEVLLTLEPPLSDKELGRGNDLSASELAAFHALTMFSVHMQSATSEAHVPGHSFGWACGRFYAQSESQSTKPRFDAMLVAADETSRLIHIRSLITLLRGVKIGFDYGSFANDLRGLGAKTTTQIEQTRRQGVLLKWGRDFAVGAHSTNRPNPQS